jgi:hypothetical protein
MHGNHSDERHAARFSVSVTSGDLRLRRGRGGRAWLGVRRIGAFNAVVMAGGLLLILLAVQNLAPARAAAFADGMPGTFVAREVTCVQHPGHEACSWLGDFRSRDGAVQRKAIAFYGSDREMFTPGQSVRAYDTGRQGHVYGPGGSNEWIAVAALLLFGCLMVARSVIHTLRSPSFGGVAGRAREDAV